MTERIVISMFATHAFADHQTLAPTGWVTSKRIPLGDRDISAINAILFETKQGIDEARDYLARHAPELLAFKAEGIDHG